MTIHLQYGSVIVRDWQANDLKHFRYWLQPHHQWHETDGPYEPAPTPEQIEGQIARARTIVESGDPPSPRRRLVIATTDVGRTDAAQQNVTSQDTMVGTVSMYWEQQASLSLNLGIAIFDPTHWGQGIGYAALGLWTQYLFDELPQIVRLGLRTWSGNVGMVRLAEKLGFQEEMRLRQARIVKGNYFDAMGYGVLRTDWTAQYPNGFAG